MIKQYKVYVDVEVHIDGEYDDDYSLDMDSIASFDTEEEMLDFINKLELTHKK